MKSNNRGFRGRGATCLVLAASVALFAWRTASAQPGAAQGARKVFTSCVIPLPSTPTLTKSGLIVHLWSKDEHKQDKVDVLFSLPISAQQQQQLEEKVAKGQTVDLKELDNFGAAQADLDRLLNWLKTQEFTILAISPDRTSVYAQATVGQLEKSLQVQFVHVTVGGITYNAAQNAPSLPREVGDGVQAILGLQPFRQFRKQARSMTPANGNRATTSNSGVTIKALDMRGTGAAPQPAPNIANRPPYLVSEVSKAYHAAGCGYTGAGQTIAILIDSFPTPADLTLFWRRNSIAPAPRVQMINVTGNPIPAPEGEETLDVEWSGGVAPGAAIRVYASSSLSFVYLDRALDQIIADLPSQPGMRQLSISLGLGETYLLTPGEPPLSGEVAVEHQKFLKLAAAGVNVFVSSGDAGSNPDNTGHASNGPLQVEYQASDPAVIGVGGTTLKLGFSGQVASELGWSGSGGGESIIFARPAYQVGPSVPAGTMRLVPDVSLAADPNWGALLILHGQVEQIGGTSWSAPVWAGCCALVNEARAKAGKPHLPFLNPLIYPLLGTACFRDITAGSNGHYDAGPGYDMVTGIGVPDVAALIRELTK